MIKIDFSKRQYISTAVAVCIMILIFCFSAQPANKSQNTSDGFVRIFMFLFYGKASIKDVDINQVESIRFIVRKCAHFSIYMALSLAATGIFSSDFKFFVKPAIKTIGFCFCYAVTDEIHQIFVAGRSASFRDVCIDTLGAAIGFLIAFLIYKCFYNKKIRNNAF